FQQRSPVQMRLVKQRVSGTTEQQAGRLRQRADLKIALVLQLARIGDKQFQLASQQAFGQFRPVAGVYLQAYRRVTVDEGAAYLVDQPECRIGSGADGQLT